MDPDLDRVIRQALADARATGRDYLGETKAAVQAVLRLRFETASGPLKGREALIPFLLMPLSLALGFTAIPLVEIFVR